MQRIRLVWQHLPLNLRIFLKPRIIRILGIFASMFSFQFLNHPIGRVSVPYFSRWLLRRSYAQQGEDLILDRILTRVLGKDVFQSYTYVDVGAYDAVDHSVTYLLYLRGWRGIVFDPSHSTRKSFRRWRRKDIFINAVVGQEDGVEVEFYVPKDASRDQSLVSTKYPQHGIIEDFNKKTIRQVSLNAELKRQGVIKINFLNIDVEGAELEILRNFDFEYFEPSVIAVEIHGNDLERCLQTEEAKIILSHGYQYVASAVITQFFVRKSEIVH